VNRGLWCTWSFSPTKMVRRSAGPVGFIWTPRRHSCPRAELGSCRHPASIRRDRSTPASSCSLSISSASADSRCWRSPTTSRLAPAWPRFRAGSPEPRRGGGPGPSRPSGSRRTAGGTRHPGGSGSPTVHVRCACRPDVRPRRATSPGRDGGPRHPATGDVAGGDRFAPPDVEVEAVVEAAGGRQRQDRGLRVQPYVKHLAAA
jgi:hypothetical protein